MSTLSKLDVLYNFLEYLFMNYYSNSDLNKKGKSEEGPYCEVIVNVKNCWDIWLKYLILSLKYVSWA